MLQCFFAEKDLADLAYNGLHSYFKEKLDGFDIFTINQVMQQALAIES